VPLDPEASRWQPEGFCLRTAPNRICGLPLIAAGMSTTLCAMQGEALPSAAPAATDPLVYIVDDEAAVGGLIAIYLTRRGYRNRVFHDSVVAYSTFLCREKPDLLITDYAMAEINGLELVRRCKEACAELKTLCVSGSLSDDILQAATVRPDAILQKPFSGEALMAHVEALLGRACGG
jgi:two-component system, OmpR family, response regulator